MKKKSEHSDSQTGRSNTKNSNRDGIGRRSGSPNRNSESRKKVSNIHRQ